MSQEERQPLLQDVEHACKSAPPTEDSHRLLQTSKYMAVNTPWLMFVNSTVGWVLLVVTAAGSHLFLQETYQTFTPKCHEHIAAAKMPARGLCYAAGICFWTFPFICMLAAVVTFGIKMYSIRLYYECLLHRIMINYDNDKVLRSCSAWMLLAYGLLAASSILFVPDKPMSTSSIVFGVQRGVFVYAAPLVSCLSAIASQWQLEWHLIPLPKFYETDPDLARKVLAEAVFVPEVHLQMVFEVVEELLDKKDLERPLGSTEYFGLLAEAIRRTAGAPPPDGPPGPAPWHVQLLAQLDLVKMEEFGRRYGQVSRPELLTWHHQLRRGGFWTHRLLHSRHLRDERSMSFRFWARVHMTSAGLAILLVTEVYVALIVDFLRYQQKA